MIIKVRTAWTISLIISCVGLLITLAVVGGGPAKRDDRWTRSLAETYIAVEPPQKLDLPTLVATDGKTVLRDDFQGHWTVIFFGFTSCPFVCPKALTVLSAVCRNPASGVSAGRTRLVFVSVDPERDTQIILKTYLAHFDRQIIGLTGTRDAISRFSREIGAGFQPIGSGFDHSTSLFVLDPKGALVGILLHPNNPTRLIADLA